MKRLLIISNKVVFPTLDGGAVAIKSLCQNFLDLNYQVDLMCIKKQGELFNENNSISSKITNLDQKIFPLNMDFNLIKLCKSIINTTSYQASRFYSNSIKNNIQKKINIANDQNNPYQIIIFESIFTVLYLKKLTFSKSSKIILRAHNVEHEIWKDLARTNVFKKIIYLFLAKQIKKMEETIPTCVDYIFTLSDIDTQWYLKRYPKKTKNIPVTFHIDENSISQINNSLVHLGAMDWKPNLEGVNWFLNNVLPKFANPDNQTKKKHIKIFIAGKGMPKKYYKYNELVGACEILVENKIKNAKEYLKNKEIMFVPLFSGSGIRIKILEGMALGMPIVSTSKGAQGIPYTHKKNIFIADTPNEFYKAICLLLTDKKLAKKIGNNGKELIKTHFAKNVVLNKLDKILN